MRRPSARLTKCLSRAAKFAVIQRDPTERVVPAKRANNSGTPAAESAEERGSTKGNVIQRTSTRT